VRAWVASVCLLGCVEVVTVARVPDAAPFPPADDGASLPAIEGGLVVTLTNNAEREGVVAEVELTTVRARGAVRAVIVTPDGGRAVRLEPGGDGRFSGRVTGYAARWQVQVVDALGTSVSTFDPPPLFVFTSPRAGARIPADMPLTLAWSPFGDANATLLSPDGPRVVADTGSVVIEREEVRGDELTVRLLREWRVPLSGAVRGALRARIVNAATFAVE
jgi:hypothetical protein